MSAKQTPTYETPTHAGVVESAKDFTAYMFFGAFNKIVEHFPTLKEAALKASALERIYGPRRMAAVYAITPDGHTHFVSREIWTAAAGAPDNPDFYNQHDQF